MEPHILSGIVVVIGFFWWRLMRDSTTTYRDSTEIPCKLYKVEYERHGKIRYAWAMRFNGVWSYMDKDRKCLDSTYDFGIPSIPAMSRNDQ